MTTPNTNNATNQTMNTNNINTTNLNNITTTTTTNNTTISASNLNNTAPTTTTTNTTANKVRRELGIASSFVKQYYTLLNKAPCFIHNFYSQFSTFIHGTIEIGNEHYTEPVVGREEIKRKMEDMKLNDCRAKIKQIDCLDTLAGGLVIQVIGELSNNGRPMRRFLQTFVLAPSPDDSRNQDGDSNHSRAGRDVHSNNESNGPAHNQKFFVLNSIFRYQDDGRDAEFEGDSSSLDQSATSDAANGDRDPSDIEHKSLRPQVASAHVNGSLSDGSQKRPATDIAERNVNEVERLATDLDENVKFNKSNQGHDQLKQEIASNGNNVSVKQHEATQSADKKVEMSDKSTGENGKPNTDHSQAFAATSGSVPTASQPASQAAPVSRPLLPNEPKTWANAVRNFNSASAPVNMNSSKPATEQQSQQVVNQSINQPSRSSLQSQQPNQQPSNSNNNSGNNNSNTNSNNSSNNNNNNNNRRRHTMRKTSNKSAGRTIKRDRARPPAGKPPA